MPRRIPDYALQFAEFNMISSIAAFVLGFSQLLFVYNIVSCARGGKKATDKVWEAHRAWSGLYHLHLLTITLRSNQ